MSRRPTAVVLLSGGLDSATTAAIALDDGYDVAALTFRYGQRHAGEIDAARRLVAAFDSGRTAGVANVSGLSRISVSPKIAAEQSHSVAPSIVEHRIIDIDLRSLGGSALTDDIAVPKDRDAAAMAAEIPITYVPARNTIFLSYALALAEVRGGHDIFIGVNAVDYSGYPDCRPEFIAAFERLAYLATRAGTLGNAIRIHAPLLHLTKPQIIRRGIELGVDFSLTRSCYDPDWAGRACGRCDSCRIRLAAFETAGLRDPAPYQAP